MLKIFITNMLHFAKLTPLPPKVFVLSNARFHSCDFVFFFSRLGLCYYESLNTLGLHYILFDKFNTYLNFF